MKNYLALCAAIAALFVFATGCETKPSKQKSSANSHDGHDHDGHDHDGHDHDGHDHDDHSDHHHEVGKNGGHMAHFDTNKAVHFEWAHDDKESTLSFFFEDIVSQGAKIDSVKVDVLLNGETQSFDIPADEKAKIKGSAFSLKNTELLTLVGASGKDAKGVQAKLIVKIDGKTESTLIVDEHDHHH